MRRDREEAVPRIIRTRGLILFLVGLFFAGPTVYLVITQPPRFALQLAIVGVSLPCVVAGIGLAELVTGRSLRSMAGEWDHLGRPAQILILAALLGLAVLLAVGIFVIQIQKAG